MHHHFILPQQNAHVRIFNLTQSGLCFSSNLIFRNTISSFIFLHCSKKLPSFRLHNYFIWVTKPIHWRYCLRIIIWAGAIIIIIIIIYIYIYIYIYIDTYEDWFFQYSSAKKNLFSFVFVRVGILCNLFQKLGATYETLFCLSLVFHNGWLNLNKEVLVAVVFWPADLNTLLIQKTQ